MHPSRTKTWVKICGTTSLADAQMSIAAGADALGFIFAPSPRRIDVELAAEVVSSLSGEVETIGVFVNETPERVAEIVQQVGLSGVQLHGDESAGQMPAFRQAVGQAKLIKTLYFNDLRRDSDLTLETYLRARDQFDAILLDSGSPQQRGGTGLPFHWETVRPIALHIRDTMPFIVAGGLNPANVAEAVELFRPWGVDVASGVESEPGKKDENKLRGFMAAVRQHAFQ